MKSVTLRMHSIHKGVIERAAERESKRLGRYYGLSEYLRDSALARAADSLGYKYRKTEYPRGPLPKTK